MQRIDKLWWCVVALLGATMVMLGAYAAHGLSARTSAAMVDIVETGVRYQAWHTLAMLAVLARVRHEWFPQWQWIAVAAVPKALATYTDECCHPCHRGPR